MSCHQVGISKILGRASQFGRDDDKETTLYLGEQSSFPGLMEQAAGARAGQFGNARSIGNRENSFAGIVESHQEPRHPMAGGSQVRLIFCAQLMSYKAIY